jgi:hypothetical protein
MNGPGSGDPAVLVGAGSADALPGHVTTVLESRCFEKAGALRTLLAYLWQHRGDLISEYAIATEALGRNESFNSKTDATVRVQISRLRQRLEKFYQAEGVTCSERLVIPLGSHHIQLEVVPNAPPVVDGAPVPAYNPPPRARAITLLAVALACVCVVLTISLLRQRPPLPRGATPRFWRAFFANGRQTRLILPTPVFFAWTPSEQTGRGSIMLRETGINDFVEHPDSPTLRSMIRDFGRPRLAQNYTVSSDTFASIHLTRYLDRMGLDFNVLSSASAPLEALDRENVIALGTWGTLAPLKPYLEHLSFVMSPPAGFVLNMKPQPGEAKQIDEVALSQRRGILPGVIAILPGRSGQTHLLILAARRTSALVSFLTSSSGLDQLEGIWKAKGSPEFYEVVVNSEMDGESLVKFWPVALHPYKAQ